VKKGISVNDWPEEYEGKVLDIDPVSISSCVRNLSFASSLSLIEKTKTAKKRKAEKELAPQLSDHEKKTTTGGGVRYSLRWKSGRTGEGIKA